MIKRISTVLLVLISIQGVFGQQRIWQRMIEKIQPLVATEAEVEKMFGKPDNRYGDSVIYELEDGRFEIVYSEGNCKESLRMINYNVNKGVVAKLYFMAIGKIKFKSSGIDISALKKSPPKKAIDTDAVFSVYHDEAKEIYYHTNKGILESIEVHPLDKFDHLKCLK